MMRDSLPNLLTNLPQYPVRYKGFHFSVIPFSLLLHRPTWKSRAESWARVVSWRLVFVEVNLFTRVSP